jgi:hypothetical protein
MKAESSLLPNDWGMPPAFRYRLGDSAGRQRVMEADGHLLLVLHAPPDSDEPGRRGRYFWRDPEGNWKAAPRAEPVSSLADHLADFRATIERLELQEEEAQGAREYFDLLDHLTPLTRAIRHLHEVLQKARATVPDERRLIVARDDAYDLSRRAELLYDDAKNGLEFAIARQAEAQAESSRQMAVAAYRLNVLVALFFPVATLMAIFGANLSHGLELWDATGGPWLLGAVTALGLLLGLVVASIIARPAPRPREASKRPPRQTKR